MKYIAILLLVLLVTGCAKISTDGTKISYSRFGSQKLEGLEFKKDANGLVELKLGKQESNDLSEAIKALNEAIKRFPTTTP